MVDPELMPCPFCGGEAYYADCGDQAGPEDWVPDPDNAVGDWVEVECTDCSARTVGLGCNNPVTVTREDAARLWNRRTVLTSFQPASSVFLN